MKKNDGRQVSTRSRGGFVLVSVMFLSLLIAILAVTAMTRGRLLGTSAIRLKALAQTQWDVQSGLEEVCAKFFDTTWTPGDIPSTERGASVTVASVAGSNNLYWVTSTKKYDGRDVIYRQKYTVTREVVGWKEWLTGVGSTNGEVTVKITTGSAIIGIGTNVEMTIVGNFDNASDLKVSNILIKVTGTASSPMTGIETNYTFTDGSFQMDAIKSKLDQYDAMISSAVASGVKYTVSQLPDNANGGTYLLKGDAAGNVDLSTDLTVSGNMTLIIAGDLTVSKNLNINLGSKVTLLIGGNIDGRMNVNITGSPDNILYVAKSIGMNMDADIKVAGGTLVRGDMSIKKDADMSGFVFVGGTLDLRKTALINGSLTAGKIELAKDAILTVDENAVPLWLSNLLDELMKKDSRFSGKVLSVSRTGWVSL